MSTIVLAACLLFGSNGFERSFDQAVQESEAGNYDQAVALYRQLIAEHVIHPAVFYNLGNAYYRMGRLGWAIANYERALQRDPDFDQARRNLTRCLNQTKRGLARPQRPDWQRSLLFWHYGVAPRTTEALAALFWLGFWAALALRTYRRLPYLTHFIAGLGLLAVVFAGSAWTKALPEMRAVAVQETVPVYYGTDPSDAPHFELYEGDRVTVDRRQNGWARVVVVDGKRGWTPEPNLAFIGPPYTNRDETTADDRTADTENDA